MGASVYFDTGRRRRQSRIGAWVVAAGIPGTREKLLVRTTFLGLIGLMLLYLLITNTWMMIELMGR